MNIRVPLNEQYFLTCFPGTTLLCAGNFQSHGSVRCLEIASSGSPLSIRINSLANWVIIAVLVLWRYSVAQGKRVSLHCLIRVKFSTNYFRLFGTVVAFFAKLLGRFTLKYAGWCSNVRLSRRMKVKHWGAFAKPLMPWKSDSVCLHACSLTNPACNTHAPYYFFICGPCGRTILFHIIS